MSMFVGRFVCLRAEAYEGQKEDTRRPKVGVTDSVSFLTWVLRVELRSSGREISPFNHYAISPETQRCFINISEALR